jgi:hypothetical protein
LLHALYGFMEVLLQWEKVLGESTCLALPIS